MKHILIVIGYFIIFTGCMHDESKLGKAVDQMEQDEMIGYVPNNQKLGMKWLLNNMVEDDKKSLSARFLLDNCIYAYKAWENTPWGSVNDSLFFEYVLPYSSLNERRDNWRQDFYERFYPIVKNAKSAYEAAVILNNNIFELVGVIYSTKRPKADQSPYESIEAGLASCTGLSFMLIDACRSVGIPARFVGTPSWYNNSGNHSWVEIWDNGWHFTGAFEPTENRLNEGWFTGLASRSVKGHPKYGIYAATWKKTDIYFPMDWKPGVDKYFAVDVTSRYQDFLDSNFIPLRIKVVDLNGERKRILVSVSGDNDFSFVGYSKDERNDVNDHLTLNLPEGNSFTIKVNQFSKTITLNKEELIEINI
ncbi:transglutaminase-like domain-containing protein [Candidatus Marinimicrobia bacterium]|nr:transglutaminase-like domain-containing protein [Candidatus Neomarinimicrobiota bacterium]